MRVGFVNKIRKILHIIQEFFLKACALFVGLLKGLYFHEYIAHFVCHGSAINVIFQRITLYVTLCLSNRIG